MRSLEFYIFILSKYFEIHTKTNYSVLSNIFLYFFYICNKFEHISIRITFMRKNTFMYFCLCFM